MQHKKGTEQETNDNTLTTEQFGNVNRNLYPLFCVNNYFYGVGGKQSKRLNAAHGRSRHRRCKSLLCWPLS